MEDVERFMREHNLPIDLQEAIEVIVFEAKEKVIKLLTERGIIHVK